MCVHVRVLRIACSYTCAKPCAAQVWQQCQVARSAVLVYAQASELIDAGPTWLGNSAWLCTQLTMCSGC